MLGGLFFVPMLGLLGIMIALYRRNPRRFLDGPTEDAPLRLMRWAVGVLSPQRVEWGQAMLGELGHLEGRIRRMRFALGCVVAALVLPPWGRAAAGVWAMIVLAAGAVGLYSGMAVRYRLGGGDWIAAAILTVFVTGVLLGAIALVRRPGGATAMTWPPRYTSSQVRCIRSWSGSPTVACWKPPGSLAWAAGRPGICTD